MKDKVIMNRKNHFRIKIMVPLGNKIMKKPEKKAFNFLIKAGVGASPGCMDEQETEFPTSQQSLNIAAVIKIV